MYAPGGVWVGPNGTGQGWEYVAYTNWSGTTLQNCVRESGTYREHNGVHTSGAPVYAWYPINTDLGEMTITRRTNREYSASYWEATFKGVMAPIWLLRNDHLIVVQYRTTPTDTWKNLLFGFIDGPVVRDDYNHEAPFTLKISSVHKILLQQEAAGIRMGDMNIARFGQATSSEPLGSAFKERYSGDYVAAEPTFEAANALDPDLTKMWIADRRVGTALTRRAQDRVTQMYLNPHVGRGPAYKWIEVTVNNNFGGVLSVYDPVANASYKLDFGSVSFGTEVTGTLIITSDPYTFVRENPAHRADGIIDLGEQGTESVFLDHCLPVGGAIGCGDYSGGALTFIACWGTVTGVPSGWTDGGPTGYFWTGTNSIDAPAAGYVMRLRHNYTLSGGEDSANEWYTDIYDHPGYMPDEVGDDAWLAVYMPGMELFLRDDVSSGAGQTLYIVDGDGNPSTDGLDSSGTIQVGDDQITYTGKTTSTLTGCSVGAAHKVGDKVYAVENGVATDAHSLKTIKLISPAVSGSPIKNEDFIVRYSRVVARTPSQSEHEQDYTSPYGGAFTVTGNAAITYSYTFSPTVRAKSLIFEFKDTYPSWGRPRVTQVQALVESTKYNSLLWINGSPSPTREVVLQRILSNSGLPALSYSVDGSLIDSITLDGLSTGHEYAWDVLSDFSDLTGAFVDVSLDSKLYLTESDVWRIAFDGYTPFKTFTRDTVAAVEFVAHGGNRVSQVQLEWNYPSGAEGGTTYYPATPDTRGAPAKMGPLIFVSESAAQLAARKRYVLTKYPYTVLIELAEGDLTIAPGQVIRLSGFTFHDEHGSGMTRFFLVTAVDHQLKDFGMVTVISGAQIDREVYW
jgi:hypothetical protein